jgi:hypothetical protein
VGRYTAIGAHGLALEAPEELGSREPATRAILDADLAALVSVADDDVRELVLGHQAAGERSPCR